MHNNIVQKNKGNKGIKIFKLIILELLLFSCGFLLWLIIGNRGIGLVLLYAFGVDVILGCVFALWAKNKASKTLMKVIAVTGIVLTGFSTGVIILPRVSIPLLYVICSIVALLLTLILWSRILILALLKKQSASSKESSTDATVPSGYVMDTRGPEYRQSFPDEMRKYGKSIEVVEQYNSTVAGSILRNSSRIPKYAVDWLADSIQRGGEIEFSAIYDSINMQLPYLCETESETWLFTKEENPLIGSTEGIYSAILRYKHGPSANQNKLKFWINRLINMADNGDNMAKGLICWRCGYILPDGKYDGILPREMWDELVRKYENSLLDSYNKGNPYAKLAIAKYKRDISEADKERLYLSAIDDSLTDACYYYIQFLNQKRFIANDMTVNIPPYGSEEWQTYMKDELSLYKRGAEFNNGIMAGYCQFRLADMYSNGDGGVSQDESMAEFWYKKSYENGYEASKNYITSL